MQLNAVAARLGIAVALVSSIGLPAAPRGQENQNVTISVHDPRPLASAIESLQNRFGWVITYEEAPWLYPGDAVDVTARVRKDRDSTKPRVLIPRGGPFNFAGSFSPEGGPAALLEALLEDYRSTGYPGVFRLLRTGDVFHVVPSMNKNAKGALEVRQPLLDVPVTIADAHRTAEAMTEAIIEGVRRGSGVNVRVALLPLNLFAQVRVDGGTNNESARTVLVRVFEATRRKLSWRLLCSQGTPVSCYLNIHPVGW